ncbi:MAG: S-layer homology domain-containing protein, partial [Firmicutes bacterium]|nr:S-layer homology domain-containing protein [Bacillota bacterium]
DQLTALRQTDSISDVPDNSGEERYEAVYQLYDAGVLTGDGEGFKPWNTITRAEVAAVVSRMGDASLRIG